ncbi:flagellar basal body-associated FliL family protein [Brevundimonas sp. BAL450]|uniref:Flagellar protein FliL n=1 Tax=Brevundimonas abyssalis TAR-001 TaxID=1391729 RepID=A0A8E0KK76_9CAUL|nr:MULTISPECIES: flagellar basal body-associated FliL family protein [Brevundimonas]MBG7615926.1 flagellar basal body-associated FliL family protein [Brevundimonas sp. BAL450]GAD58790.1 flagellar biosynthesis protein fliL [Brevundimonas abyssalis TAR-001]
MLKFGKKKKDAGLPATTDAPTEGGDAAEGEGAPGKKKPPMLLIIGAAAAVVLLGGGAAAFFLMQPGSAEASGDEAPASPPPPEKGGGHGGGGGEEGGEGVGVIASGPDGVTFYTLPDMVVNIQSADGRPTFLKLKLTLEMEDAHLAQTLQAEAPRLQDMFQGYLRELRPEELAGSAGSHQLRQELLRRVNLIAAPGQVDAVLIEEMLVQ